MKYERLEKYVSLSQGLVVNKGTADLFSDIQDDDHPYPLLRIVDFENGNHASYSKFVSKDVPEKNIIDENAILFTRVTCQCFRGFRGVFHNNLFRVELVSDEITEDYLYVMLQSGYVKKQALQFTSSSVVPDLSHDKFKAILIPVPDIDVQNEIVSVYTSLQSKIDNNNAICSNLEAMAKLLYDYWFVQFDFPDENGKPYKSSGGKMVWNDELKREIPAGWEVKKLLQLASYSENKVSADTLSFSNYIGIDNMLPDMKGRVTSEYTPTKGLCVGFTAADVLLGNIRPYFKKIWFSDGAGGCSPDVLVIRSKNTDIASFIFSSLAKDDFFAYDMAGSKGSKMPRGDKDHIMHFPIAYENNSAYMYSQKVRTWFNKIADCYHENQQLASLRDFLLPMLMNGQVTITPQKKEA